MNRVIDGREGRGTSGIWKAIGWTALALALSSASLGALNLLICVLVVGSALGMGAGTAAAQLHPSPRAEVFVQVGLEPHLVLSAGFLRPLRATDARATPMSLGASASIPPYQLRQGAGRLNLVARSAWNTHAAWGATATAEVYVARGRNRAGTIHGLGVELRAAPGYQAENWSAAADLGWQGTLLAHIAHSEEARATFEERYSGAPPPIDGWYGATAQRVRVGLIGSRALTDDLALELSAGSRFVLQRQGIALGFAHGQVPVYLETLIRVRR